MNYPSYKALCADPATQSEFLLVLADKLAAIPQEWKQREVIAAVLVDGKPLSVSKYLATLDMESVDWDHDGQERRAEHFVAAAKRIARVHPHLDVPNFVYGFADLPGANLPARLERPRFEPDVTGHLVAPTVGRTGFSSPKERVDVALEPAANSARRMRAA
jgi:hypothetical protein